MSTNGGLIVAYQNIVITVCSEIFYWLVSSFRAKNNHILIQMWNAIKINYLGSLLLSWKRKWCWWVTNIQQWNWDPIFILNLKISDDRFDKMNLNLNAKLSLFWSDVIWLNARLSSKFWKFSTIDPPNGNWISSAKFHCFGKMSFDFMQVFLE